MKSNTATQHTPEEWHTWHTRMLLACVMSTRHGISRPLELLRERYGDIDVQTRYDLLCPFFAEILGISEQEYRAR